MIETLVIATDGSASATRAVEAALDLVERFDAEVHALYVVDSSEFESAPEGLRADLRDGLAERGEDATAEVAQRAENVTTAVRVGRPATEICEYARDVGADVVATGTRGRHGEHRLLIGSVAERVVRACPMPVLTVRRLEE